MEPNLIEIKHRYNNKVLFSYECDDNTIKKTVEEAVRQGVNLAYAKLSGTDLSGVDLIWANLAYVDVRNTDLRYAKLDHANLNNAIIFDGVVVTSTSPLYIGNIVGREYPLYAFNTNKGIYLKTGCFFEAIEVFKEKVLPEYKDTIHEKQYNAAVLFIETMMS